MTDISLNDNLIIKGNNLLSLYSLKERYQGKIKLIYIDPPYNPDSKSNTFVYNNSFNESTWLTFMKNRLEVAKKLLTSDGCLIVAIDKNEQAELTVLLKEIFRNYEIHVITIVHNPRGAQGINFSYTHEYAIFVIPKGKKTIVNRKIEPSKIK
jgi:adenine-specific DNA-methyltransferase